MPSSADRIHDYERHAGVNGSAQRHNLRCHGVIDAQVLHRVWKAGRLPGSLTINPCRQQTAIPAADLHGCALLHLLRKACHLLYALDDCSVHQQLRSQQQSSFLASCPEHTSTQIQSVGLR